MSSKNKPLLDNVRLWDWRPFHDTVTQMQALRPYYAFHGTDVDRYTIDGKYRQVLLSSRELDINQLPGTQSSWINPHFIYTHGYGLVLAEVSRITPEGQPVYLIEDMPPVSQNAQSQDRAAGTLLWRSCSMSRSSWIRRRRNSTIPQGSDNAKTRYAGKGGFPISSLLMRAAAALDFGDSNIILTGYLTDHSRMMIHRRVRERLADTRSLFDVGRRSLYCRSRRKGGWCGWWMATQLQIASVLAADRCLSAESITSETP